MAATQLRLRFRKTTLPALQARTTTAAGTLQRRLRLMAPNLPPLRARTAMVATAFQRRRRSMPTSRPAHRLQTDMVATALLQRRRRSMPTSRRALQARNTTVRLWRQLRRLRVTAKRPRRRCLRAQPRLPLVTRLPRHRVISQARRLLILRTTTPRPRPLRRREVFLPPSPSPVEHRGCSVGLPCSSARPRLFFRIFQLYVISLRPSLPITATEALALADYYAAKENNTFCLFYSRE
jgi:hypothetical protein